MFDPAVREAIRSGAVGEQAMVAAFTAAKGWRRNHLVAALGDFRAPGPADEALREVIRTDGPGTRDLRCVALLALAKRLGADATPGLVEGLKQRDGAVREYALIALAQVGDVRAFEPVLDLVSSRRPGLPVEPRALAYLVRVAGGASRDERLKLVGLLRRRWQVLITEGVAAALLAAWPGVQPGGPYDPGAPLDPDQFGLSRHDRLLMESSAVL